MAQKYLQKQNLLHNLIEYFDNIVLVEQWPILFFFAKGFNVGKSLVEKELIETLHKQDN